MRLYQRKCNLNLFIGHSCQDGHLQVIDVIGGANI